MTSSARPARLQRFGDTTAVLRDALRFPVVELAAVVAEYRRRCDPRFQARCETLAEDVEVWSFQVDELGQWVRQVGVAFEQAGAGPLTRFGGPDPGDGVRHVTPDPSRVRPAPVLAFGAPRSADVDDGAASAGPGPGSSSAGETVIAGAGTLGGHLSTTAGASAEVLDGPVGARRRDLLRKAGNRVGVAGIAAGGVAQFLHDADVGLAERAARAAMGAGLDLSPTATAAALTPALVGGCAAFGPVAPLCVGASFVGVAYGTGRLVEKVKELVLSDRAPAPGAHDPEALREAVRRPDADVQSRLGDEVARLGDDTALGLASSPVTTRIAAKAVTLTSDFNTALADLGR
ncbi:MAG: hypothetical protein ACT4PW_05775 [Acidimicrobiia bacterium]